MFKRIIKYSVLIIVTLGIIYVGTDILMEVFSYGAINYIIKNMNHPGMELSNMSFESSTISSLTSVTWNNFSLIAIINNQDVSKPNRKVKINIDRLTVKAAGLYPTLLLFKLRGLNITVEYITKDASSAFYDTPTLLKDASLTVPVKVNLLSRTKTIQQLREFAVEMKIFMEEGRTTLPIESAAEEIVSINNNTYSMSVYAEKKGGIYQLMANVDDLVFISQNVLPEAQSSTPADIDIIANNPLKAPKLFRIRSRAANVALDAHEKDPKVPEDAYRNVLWSYLLTREYGADFAKKVTDAHEQTTDTMKKYDPNAELYHRQDYNNNDVGRRYAKQQVNESDIQQLIMTDPEVMRDDELRQIH